VIAGYLGQGLASTSALAPAAGPCSARRRGT
jgi:hypothetical protein